MVVLGALNPRELELVRGCPRAALGRHRGRALRVAGRGLGRKHLLEDRQDGGQRGRREPSQAADQAAPIDCAHLVENDVAGFTADTAMNAKGVGVRAGCKRRHDERGEMGVELVR